jgi:hypothetical protein
VGALHEVPAALGILRWRQQPSVALFQIPLQVDRWLGALPLPIRLVSLFTLPASSPVRETPKEHDDAEGKDACDEAGDQ